MKVLFICAGIVSIVLFGGCSHYNGTIEAGVNYSDNRPTFSASFKLNLQ